MPDIHPHTPKKFLTNQGENTLSKRLEKILPLTQDFDCLGEVLGNWEAEPSSDSPH